MTQPLLDPESRRLVELYEYGAVWTSGRMIAAIERDPDHATQDARAPLPVFLATLELQLAQPYLWSIAVQASNRTVVTLGDPLGQRTDPKQVYCVEIQRWPAAAPRYMFTDLDMKTIEPHTPRDVTTLLEGYAVRMMVENGR